MCRWPRLLADHLIFAQDDAGAAVRGSGLPPRQPANQRNSLRCGASQSIVRSVTAGTRAGELVSSTGPVGRP